jgi:hypothetical protein
MSRPSGAKIRGKVPRSKTVILSEGNNLGSEMFRSAQHDKKKIIER